MVLEGVFRQGCRGEQALISRDEDRPLLVVQSADDFADDAAAALGRANAD